MPVPHAPAVTPRPFLADIAYDRLLGAILDGALLPGERLQDADLVAWLGISRTPIREAIERLADEGLVELAPNRYTRVAVPTDDDYVDVLHTVVALHCRSIARVLPRADDATIDQFLEVVEKARARIGAPDGIRDGSALRALQAVAAFHTERSPNQLIRRLVAGLEGRLVFIARTLALPLDEREVAAFLDAVGTAARARDAGATIAALLRLIGAEA